MPPQTITDPPPNRSCWRMLQAAERSPQHLQTLSCLSHVLSVNLHSSVKSTACRWRICQPRCSLAKVNRAAWCWAVSTGPNCGRQALKPSSCILFLTVWAETCTLVACWRSFCRALAVLLLLLLAQRTRWRSCCGVVVLLRPPPRLLVYWPVSRYLLHALDTVLRDTSNLLATAHIEVPSWMSCTTWETSVGCRYRLMPPLVVRALAKWKTNQRSARKDEDRQMVCGHHLQIHSFYRGCLANCLISTWWKLVNWPTSEIDSPISVAS